MEKLLTYLNGLPKADRLAFVARCETSEGYLRKAISKGQRLGESLCINIDRESGGAVRCEDVRPDVDWEYLRSSCVDTPALGVASAVAEPPEVAHHISAPLDQLRNQYGFKGMPIDEGDAGAAFVAYVHFALSPTREAHHLHEQWAQARGLAGEPPAMEGSPAQTSDFIDWLIEEMWNEEGAVAARKEVNHG